MKQLLFPRANTAELGTLTALFSRSVRDWKLGGTRTQSDSFAARRLRRHARLLVWQLRRAFESAAGRGFVDEVLDFFHTVAPDGEQSKKAFLAWVALIEVLVQEAERELGTIPGRGPEKAAQVRAALLHILVREEIDIPAVPQYLEPIVLEAAVNWFIDTVVMMLNQSELWEPAPSRPPMRLSVFARIIRWLFRLSDWLLRLAPVARLGSSLRALTRRAVLTAYPMSPDVRAAVMHIETTRGAAITDVVVRIVDILKWLGTHRQSVVAMIEVVSAAVQEAEFIGGLSGPEKKIYARELVLAFLEDIGVVEGDSGLLYHLVNNFLDGVIDATVLVFNTRAESFGHRARPVSTDRTLVRSTA